MEIKLIKCGVCDNWHSPWSSVMGKLHCPNCGAHHRVAFLGHVTGPCTTKRAYHLNARGIEMVRGVPPSVHSTIERLIKHLAE